MKSNDYLRHVTKVIRQNETFIRRNAAETSGEIVELVNDAIDYAQNSARKVEWEKEYLESPLAFFQFHVLMLFSNAIYLDMITGNIPACYMQLRLLVESLAKCCYATIKYPDEYFFLHKLEEIDSEKGTTTKFLKKMDRILDFEKGYADLWRKCSNEWIHTRGFSQKVVKHISEKSDVSPWALIIPMIYTKSDLECINELETHISEFRNLLKNTMAKLQESKTLNHLPE
jgi:hypothetical protein